jgi:hypothetical protein
LLISHFLRRSCQLIKFLSLLQIFHKIFFIFFGWVPLLSHSLHSTRKSHRVQQGCGGKKNSTQTPPYSGDIHLLRTQTIRWMCCELFLWRRALLFSGQIHPNIQWCDYYRRKYVYRAHVSSIFDTPAGFCFDLDTENRLKVDFLRFRRQSEFFWQSGDRNSSTGQIVKSTWRWYQQIGLI